MTPTKSSRRVMRAAIAAVIACSALAPSRAADSGAGCGTGKNETYTTADDCHLTFRGFPITVYADATVASGNASVRVWATFEQLDGTPLAVVECTHQAPGFATCGNAFPDEITQVDSLLLNQSTLACHVRSRGTGTYRCVSASGR